MSELINNQEINTEIDQNLLCQKYSAPFQLADLNHKIGISDEVLLGKVPIHGLRHPAEGETTGWYLWAGDFRDDIDFFKPVHLHHLYELKPEIIKFFGLAAGWRFMYDENHEDVWYDENLLSV